MFTSPGSIAFNFLSLNIRWYGIIMAFSILLALFVILAVRKKCYKDDIPEDNIFDIALLLIIFGIIGARAYYVMLDWTYFEYHLAHIPCIWHGGISIHGAIIGGMIASFIYAKKKKLNFLKYADLFSFGVITGQIIGRWGNFFNSEAFGLPCDLPWKLYIPFDCRPIGFQNYQFFHPTFLYESFLNILILIIMFLYMKLKKKKRPDGAIFFLYISLYSIVRHFIETLRIDSVLNIAPNVHVAHIAALAFLLFGFSGFYYIHTKKA